MADATRDCLETTQSMLLKRGSDAKGQTDFTYKPKKIPKSQLPPALPAFTGCKKA